MPGEYGLDMKPRYLGSLLIAGMIVPLSWKRNHCFPKDIFTLSHIASRRPCRTISGTKHPAPRYYSSFYLAHFFRVLLCEEERRGPPSLHRLLGIEFHNQETSGASFTHPLRVRTTVVSPNLHQIRPVECVQFKQNLRQG